jgi:hypothetical protein
MTPLSSDTVLFRAPGVELTLTGALTVEIHMDDGRVVTNERALNVLSVFAQPLSLGDALLRLGATSAQDWIDLSTSILHLYEAGILRDASQSRAYRDSEGFAAARVHIEMLDDRLRTTSFLTAIREVVRPGDVVVDVGTGTGVLAIAAAKAGARRVYAVEETSIGESAKAMFLANGVGDRVTLVAGRSSRVDLPERANVFVSEVIGNDIFDERILEVVRDSQRRHLTPDARFVPRALRVFALPLDVPNEELAKQLFASADLKRWQSLYGIDFAPLAERSYGNPGLRVPAHRTRDWRRMGEPVLLADINLAVVDRTDVEAEATCVVREEGVVSGFLVYFEAELSPTVTLSMHPDRGGAESSWTSKVTILPNALRVQAGDRLSLRYSYRGKSRLDLVARAPARPGSPDTG